ncbi:hypothetical protein LV779_24940 [Streptomyces thinghirensis]|nr:hypothetical protein [Streptomyces thinghirensis]
MLIPLLPLAGILSDRIGRKPMLIAGAVACLVPGAAGVQGRRGRHVRRRRREPAHLHRPGVLPHGHRHGLRGRTLATRTRFSASAIAYNSSFSVFMGITPFVAALLVNTFDTIYAVYAYPRRRRAPRAAWW